MRRDRDNTFSTYKDLLLPRDDRDPTTAVITLQDELVDDSYASYVDPEEEAAADEDVEELDMGRLKIVDEATA